MASSGIPPIIQAAPTEGHLTTRLLTFGFRAHMLPGVLACFAAATAVLLGIRLLPGVSALLVAILLGVAYRNLVGVPAGLEAGITYTSKTLLRAGIILLGLQLALGDILSLGWEVVLLVVVIVASGMTVTYYLGRLLKLGRTQSLLIASGFSICGAAAVAAASDVTDSSEEETLTSIALVVIFGTAMIPLIPFLAQAMGMDANAAGLWTGGAVHEVAQVVAIGGIIGGTALSVAVIVKLARVLMLAPVMAILAWSTRRSTDVESGGKRPPLVPVFLVAFIVAVAVRSLGILPESVLAAGQWTQGFLLTAAMFGLGCGIKSSFFKQIGPKPFILGLASTLVVGSVALCGALLLA